MQDTKYNNGFTLVELLVALVVTSIILTAVVTLAYALGTTNDTTDDTSQKQAQLRSATLRISELIRHCKLVCAVPSPGDDIVIWKADDNPENGKIDILELAYIERGNGGNYIRILEFSSCPEAVATGFRNQSSQIIALGQSGRKNSFILDCDEVYTQLIPQCSEVQFFLDTPAPQTQLVGISFELQEGGVTRSYQINAAVRGWAGHLLSSDGMTIVGDDD